MLKTIINTILINYILKKLTVGKSIVVMKRFRPRAKGRASGINKTIFSNLTIILSEQINQKKWRKDYYGTKS